MFQWSRGYVKIALRRGDIGVSEAAGRLVRAECQNPNAQTIKRVQVIFLHEQFIACVRGTPNHYQSFASADRGPAPPCKKVTCSPPRKGRPASFPYLRNFKK